MSKNSADKKKKVKKRFYFFYKIWKVIVNLPIIIVEESTSRVVKLFRSSLSFRITISFVVMNIFNFLVLILVTHYSTIYMYLGLDNLKKMSNTEYFGFTLIVAVILITFMFGVGKHICDKELKPIRDITVDMKKISSKNLDYRLDATIMRDELKDLVEYFNLMMDEIEIAYDKKTQFVSDASHELRTPISVIGGYMSMLKRWGKKDEAILDEAINAVVDEAEQMKSLVEKLLFLARSDKNKIEFERTSVDLTSILMEMEKECNVVSPKKTFSFRQNVNGNVFVLGSREMLKQMLRVFLENSLKFTAEDGCIEFFLEAKGRNVSFGVKDNGIGIAEKDLPHIFDRFYKADESRTNKAAGSGLGLSIAKLIISAHGASVHVSSEINRGTKTTITMPIL